MSLSICKLLLCLRNLPTSVIFLMQLSNIATAATWTLLLVYV